MKIHYIRHESFEGLAYIDSWIRKKQFTTTCTHIYKNQEFPKKLDFDLLIIMGGSGSIYREPEPIWLTNEKQFLACCIEKEIKILGICFGAQLIANVLGAKVYPAINKEIGWLPIKFNSSAVKKISFLPDEIVTFHWHGDTFDLPAGTSHLASSECTPNQGFYIDNRVLALQFHPEMNEESINSLTAVFGNKLEKERFVQTEQEMKTYNHLINENNRLMELFLEYLCT